MEETRQPLPKYARWVIGSMLLCMAIPFATFQNWYPFYRFGMFAEPLTRQVQQEAFAVYRLDSANGHWLVFDGQAIGLNEGNFQLLMRNYRYRNNCALFLEKLQQACPSAGWKFVEETAPTEAKVLCMKLGN